MARLVDLLARAYYPVGWLPPTAEAYARRIGRCDETYGSGASGGVVPARFGKNRAWLMFNASGDGVGGDLILP
jgi:hypothetical protein